MPSENSKPFWDETYQNLNVETFGKTSAEIIQLAEILDKNSVILDLGCGEGRNAVFLAEQGFRVDAIDISKAGITKLLKIAQDRNVEINAWVGDMIAFQFDKSYDFIISHGVLHLAERHEWQELIPRMKQFTRPGGVNVVAVFTDKIRPSEDMAPFTKGLFSEGELAKWYSDWEIESSESYVFTDNHPNGISHQHPVNKIIAWKR